MNKTIVLFLFSLLSLNLMPQKNVADSLYILQRYQDALTIYSELLESGENADIHYNLANCFYRVDDIARAVLHYEKALKIDPTHEDAQYNLELCREKIGEYDEASYEMFYTTLFRKWAFSKNANQWMFWCYGSFALLLIAVAGFVLSSNITIRKVAFWGGLLALCCVVLFNVFAYQAKSYLYDHSRVVVLETTQLYEGPTEQARILGTLLPGTTYVVDVKHGEEWLRFQLSDGSVGWCSRSSVEFI